MRNILLLSCLIFSSTTALFAQRYWVDTDIVTGKFGKDVDDGLALIMLLENPEVELVGISLIGAVDVGQEVTERILSYRASKTTIPIYKGATTKEQLGQENPATLALADALRKEKLKIFGLGPITNLATVLKLHPELAQQVSGVILCMGRQANEKFVVGTSKKLLMDYNYEKDPEAMAVLLKTEIPLVLAGFPASSPIHITKKDVRKIKRSGTVGNKWLATQLNEWLFCWKLALGAKYFIPFDAVTIGYYTHPELFVIEENVSVQAIEAPKDSKFKNKDNNPNKPYLIVGNNLPSQRTVSYVYMPKEGFKEVIMKALIGKK